MRACESSQTANLLVGCNGASSQVRTLLLGAQAAELRNLLLSLFYFTQTYTAEQALHMRSVHPIIKIGSYPETGVLVLMSSTSSSSSLYVLLFSFCGVTGVLIRWVVDREQGLNDAMMDSANLVDWLRVVEGRNAVRDAVGKYEAELRRGGQKR